MKKSTDMANIEQKKLTVEIAIATVLALAGITLLFLGFYAIPVGEISASVLTAFGETATFSGALLGIDYSYRYKRYKLESEERIAKTDTEENQ